MEEKIIDAEFNPEIKKYFLFLGILILTISIVGIIALPFWILGLGQIISKKYFENLKCQLTNHHLKFRKGVFFKVEKTKKITLHHNALIYKPRIFKVLLKKNLYKLKTI